MIFVVSCILALFMTLSAGGIRRHGNAMLAGVNHTVEENVRQQLLDLAGSISNYVLTLEAEIDRTMLNAARTLYEADRLTGGRLTLADLERLKRQTGMSDMYLGNMNGIFTLSTEPGAAGISLFDIWDGYRMLVTGASDYLPSDMKIKVETGEIFKFTAIPRADNRGVLESALNASAIEDHLQHYITAASGIRSMNLFDNTLLTLTDNLSEGAASRYTKGTSVPPETEEVAGLFQDASKIKLDMNRNDAVIYYPVVDNGRVRYVLFIDLDTSGYFALGSLIETPIQGLIQESLFLNTISLASVFVSLLVFTVFISIMISRLLKPLGFFNTMLASFAEGDFSLTVPRALISRKDEIGEMSRSFGNVLDRMKNLVMVIRNQSLSLQNIGKDLAVQMEQTAQAINGITGNIRGMKDQTGQQAAGVTETGKSVEQIMNTANKLHEQITLQSENVSRSSQAIEGMLGNIHMVVETLTKNTQNVTALTETSEVGRTDLQKVSSDIQEIAKESEGILEINAVMENIASQTNLLSMNAAIEAAHAGELGKGFAVVAGEIRKLAESSSRQSKTTADMLKKIKGSIDTITQSMAAVFERFQSIEREVQTVASQEESIHTMMADQEQGSRNVLDAVTQLNSVTEIVQQGSQDMAGKSEKIMQESGGLERITRIISGEMTGIADGAEQINHAVLRVNAICEENRRSIDTLTAEITKFKIE
jgi:methyl-accepting chemotaxis protein